MTGSTGVELSPSSDALGDHSKNLQRRIASGRYDQLWASSPSWVSGEGTVSVATAGGVGIGDEVVGGTGTVVV